MKTILAVIENYTRKETNKFIIYVITVALVLFYAGFVFGRSFVV